MPETSPTLRMLGAKISYLATMLSVEIDPLRRLDILREFKEALVEADRLVTKELPTNALPVLAKRAGR